MATRLPIPPAAPVREDLFGPWPEPPRGRDLGALRRALARRLLSLAAPAGRATLPAAA
jgi:hypothetical protein